MIEQARARTACVFFLFIVLYLIVIGYLYLLQIYQRGFFMDLGERQYTTIVTTTPARAEIFDRKGNLLAVNRDSLAAFIIPQKLENYNAVHKFLKKHFPQAAQRLEKNRTSYFMYIKRRLTEQEQQLIAHANIADIKILKEPSRFYPVASAGPIIGLTDIDNNGLFGIELQYNKRLAGKPTTMFLERDCRSGHFCFSKELKVQGAAGIPLTLTIDSHLQFLVYEELKDFITQFPAQEGAVLIMDPDSGEILTMAQYPDFDPNAQEQLSIAHTRNKIITDTYELGSVMKTFLAFAALEEGIVTPEELIDCENKTTALVEGMRVNTLKAHGLISFSQVIEFSNNIGTAKIALRVGSKLYDHYKRFGFGSKTGVSLVGERTGFINPPDRWSKRSLFSLSYGYEITATLLQLGRAFCIIARNGYDVVPKLVNTIEKLDTQKEAVRLYSEKTIAVMQDILTKTVEQGTAKRAAIKGYQVMGKTGTARLLIDGKYVPNRNIFTFACIVRKGKYQRVIVTFVKEAAKKELSASVVAVPLSERIAQKMLIHEKIIA